MTEDDEGRGTKLNLAYKWISAFGPGVPHALLTKVQLFHVLFHSIWAFLQGVRLPFSAA